MHRYKFWKSDAILQMFSVYFPRKYYFEGPGAGKLVSVDKYVTELSTNSGKSEKKGIPQKYYLKLFSENIPPGWTVPFELSPECPMVLFKW